MAVFTVNCPSTGFISSPSEFRSQLSQVIIRRTKFIMLRSETNISSIKLGRRAGEFTSWRTIASGLGSQMKQSRE